MWDLTGERWAKFTEVSKDLLTKLMTPNPDERITIEDVE
jgi:hypothetical protein